jgi:hypothetical protein
MVIFAANMLILFAIAFMISKKEFSLRLVFWSAYLFKIGAGLFIGWLYQYYYMTGDTFDYFKEASRMTALAQENFSAYLTFLWSSEVDVQTFRNLNLGQPRALFFTKFVSLIGLVTNNNYWLTTCYFSLISFASAWGLVREIKRICPALSVEATFAFLFFPSIVVWSSGLIKESLAMAGLFFIVKIFLRLWSKEKISYAEWMIFPFSLWVLWSLKYYFMAVLLPILVTELLMKRVIAKRLLAARPVVYGLLWMVCFILPLVLITFLHPNFYPERFLDVIVSNHDLFVSISQPEEVIRFSSLQADAASILRNVPNAFFSGIFRPFLWEATNALQFAAAFENMVLLLLVPGFLIGLVKSPKPSALVWPTLLYCLLLVTFLALSTPNFGTLNRYRVGFLPFLVLLLSYNNIFINKLKELAQRKV